MRDPFRIGLELAKTKKLLEQRQKPSLNKQEVKDQIEILINIILGKHENEIDMQQMHDVWRGVLGFESGNAAAASDAAFELLTSLPDLSKVLEKDINFTFINDPAATSTNEIVLCYPGIFATAVHRIAHVLYDLGYKMIARLTSEIAHEKTGIDIHPGAQIGEGLFVDHGTGIVIGETTVIGKECKIFHHVTLGNKKFDYDKEGVVCRGQKRHPTIGDRVTLYAGATVLGGDTTIADDVVIGAGAFVDKSISEHNVCVVTKRENRIIQLS